MENSLFSTNDIVKYLIIIGLIYSILKIIPSQQITNRDLVLIVVIAIVGFISVDCVFFKKNKTEGFESNTGVAKSNGVEKTNDLDLTKLLQNNQPVKTEQKTSCGIEADKVKKQLEDEINVLKNQLQSKGQIPNSDKMLDRYFKSLMDDVVERGLLDSNDVENIKVKLQSKLLSMEEIINSLEIIKKEGKSKVRTVNNKNDDKIYNELPSDFYSPIGNKIANEWDNDYTLLNTTKWQVPMARPPLCINTTPCKVCPSDSSSQHVNLKEWDDSRKVTDNVINKKWANDQASA
jgi:hypothetical protein